MAKFEVRCPEGEAKFGVIVLLEGKETLPLFSKDAALASCEVGVRIGWIQPEDEEGIRAAIENSCLPENITCADRNLQESLARYANRTGERVN